jgi:hypothetical protein
MTIANRLAATAAITTHDRSPLGVAFGATPIILGRAVGKVNIDRRDREQPSARRSMALPGTTNRFCRHFSSVLARIDPVSLTRIDPGADLNCGTQS